ncbi:hypothetical protein NDU88_003032 [Pleurodeles waltl]|uniref:Uncharacterized protein n=1 Tax=Pleurodeles waltl TaxID=8319 RepID=A0AAV7PB47_PLEWA|nr:hypothetical protein NDU88_003032 [Pleurodeles waltl]
MLTRRSRLPVTPVSLTDISKEHSLITPDPVADLLKVEEIVCTSAYWIKHSRRQEMDRKDSQKPIIESNNLSDLKEENTNITKEDSASSSLKNPENMEEPDLPQFQMGQTKVDDMRFMVVCTNWY